jgi:hypothetical protein
VPTHIGLHEYRLKDNPEEEIADLESRAQCAEDAERLSRAQSFRIKARELKAELAKLRAENQR